MQKSILIIFFIAIHFISSIFFPGKMFTVTSIVAVWNFFLALLILLPLSFFKKFKTITSYYFKFSSFIYGYNVILIIGALVSEAPLSPISTIIAFCRNITWEATSYLVVGSLLCAFCAVYADRLESKS